MTKDPDQFTGPAKGSMKEQQTETWRAGRAREGRWKGRCYFQDPEEKGWMFTKAMYSAIRRTRGEDLSQGARQEDTT